MFVSFKKENWYGFKSTIFLLIILYVVLGTTKIVLAADTDTKVIVSVGYWGGEKYTRAEMKMPELIAMYGTDKQIYTWIDKNGNAGTSEAEGIYIYRLMNELGINMDSIYEYNFRIKDGNNGTESIKQWTPSQLFDTKYSLYPAYLQCLTDDTWWLSDFFNMAANRSSASYLQNAWDEKEEVEPMLALYKKNSIWKDGITPSTLDFTDLSALAMPQLLFGQSGMNNSGRGYAEEGVEEIDIWFSGYPTITVDSSELKGDIGSTCRVKISVSTPDEFLTEQIAEGSMLQIQWSSDDESIAKVDSNGNVTFVNDGTTNVTANYNGNHYTVEVTSGTGSSSKPTGSIENNSVNSSQISESSSFENDSNKNSVQEQLGNTIAGMVEPISISSSDSSNKDIVKKTIIKKWDKANEHTAELQKPQLARIKHANRNNEVNSKNSIKRNIYELPKNVIVLPNINKDSKYKIIILVVAISLMVIGVLVEAAYFRSQIK